MARPPDTGELLRAAITALRGLPPAAQLRAALRRLRGAPGGPLGGFPAGSELAPGAGGARLDGRLLEAICARALGGEPGAVFTAEPEARILAAFGLAHAAEARGGPPAAEALEALLGLRPAAPALAAALSGLRVLDPACGGGSLLVEAERLARRAGARLSLLGLDRSPLAARACAARLSLAGAAARVARADALSRPWPASDLVLMNPPFVRHEAVPRKAKARARAASGLPAQADLSAHFAAVALRRSPVVALVWPRALFTSRSAAPLLAEAAARGGFVLRLRSRAAGSFAASVDTLLAVWRAGARDLPLAEASTPLAALEGRELASLAHGAGGRRVRLARRAAPAPRGSVRVGDVCQVRFGIKSGCNGFFHLRPLGGGRYRSALAGEVRLSGSDVAPLLATLKEARAPEVAEPRGVLFRPTRDTATARAYRARGESLEVHLRPTCAARSPWWMLAPGRAPAPVLYPAKVGARAFAFLNEAGLFEDKKWHALFPGEVEPWLLALLLSSTPLRLAVDLSARQLTGAQAIADVDCRVLAAAPFPAPAALGPLRAPLARCRAALAADPVSTDLAAMLDRPAQRELDLLAGGAMGLSPAAVERQRRELLERVRERLERAGRVREAIRRRA